MALIPGELSEEDLTRVALQFGVAEEQVRRDHAISHTLAAIASIGTDGVVFFGGTALSRTLLTTIRLSEDIDLIARGDRTAIGNLLESAITKQLRGTLGAANFTPHFRDAKHPNPSVMQVGDTSIQIQLLSSEGYPDWPTELVDIEQRYGDAPSALLRVPTPAAFVASKLAAWTDREAPRDLYDLWALVEAGWLDADAFRLYGKYGQFTSAAKVPLGRIPSVAEWNDALGHQCLTQVTPVEAARAVRQALDLL